MVKEVDTIDLKSIAHERSGSSPDVDNTVCYPQGNLLYNSTVLSYDGSAR